METQVKLTVQQRRMIVEHFAEECAQEMPADVPGLEIEQHIEKYRLLLSLALDARPVNAGAWATLVGEVLDYQSFDRDPAGYLHEEGWDGIGQVSMDRSREMFNDDISALINAVAGR